MYMRKNSMALIIAGLTCGPTFAQSNVTLYGILDVSVAAGSAVTVVMRAGAMTRTGQVSLAVLPPLSAVKVTV